MKPSSGKMEVCCQGANLAQASLSLPGGQSPYAEIELDGKVFLGVPRW